jgi:hypothetical protein
MRSGWLLAAILAGCYQPTLHEGAPCGPGASCPTGQECRTGTCYFTTTPADANAGGDDAADVDASMIVTPDAPPDGPPYIAWGTPALLTSLETTGSGEDDPTISNDKLTVILKAAPTGQTDDDLYMCTRTALTDTFTCALITALNATPSQESSPEISPDGLTLYFSSDRVTAGNGDVYKSTYSNGMWGAPVMDADLSVGNVGDHAISPDGLTAVTIHSGTFYVFSRATTSAAWGTGTVHNELTTGVTSVAAPTITNGAQTIYFHAGSPRDIYVSHRNANGTFQTATAVAELNTTATRDAAPFVLQSDKYMIFERDYDIFETSR